MSKESYTQLMRKPLSAVPHLQLMIPVIFWGFSYIAIKAVLTQLTPVEMISARLFLASIVLLIILRQKKIPLSASGHWKQLIVMSGVVFMHFWVMAIGMLEVTASDTAWILTTAPICIALFSWLYLKESFTLVQWLGLIVAAVGVIALAYNGNAANLQWHNSRGELILLGSCVTWAVYTVGTRIVTRHVDPLLATFWMSAFAAMIFVPWTLFHSGIQPYLNLESTTAMYLVFLGVCCLAIAYWMWAEGLKRAPAAEVGIYLYVEPLITVLGAWWLLGEYPTLWLWIGAALICVGVYVTEKMGRASTVRQAHDKQAQHDDLTQ